MAGKGGKGGAKNKKKKELQGGRVQYVMRLVESSTCEVCKTPCTRGMNYLAKMKEPGAIGYGVPCILTRKAVQ
jgi:hypothetical protein